MKRLLNHTEILNSGIEGGVILRIYSKPLDAGREIVASGLAGNPCGTSEIIDTAQVYVDPNSSSVRSCQISTELNGEETYDVTVE